MPINHSVSIGWIGLGKLGLAMAGRLAAAGFSVAGYDRDQSRIALARERGLVSAANPKAAVENKDVVFASLPDDKVLRMAVLGETGLLAMMRRGSILVETSTVGAEVSAEVAQESGARSIAYLRLPVSGNPTLAETGTLTCFASGPRSALDAVQPLLATFTRAQTYLGGAEEARYAKLAINLMIAVSAGMIAETLALARKGNIAWRDILDVLAESAIASPMVKYK